MNRIRVWWVWRDVVIEIQTPAYQQTRDIQREKAFDTEFAG